MKKIETIIRKTKFEEVKEALYEAGIEFFSFWEVRGIGKATEHRVYRGIKYDTSTIERIYIQFVVREKYLEPAVNALLRAAKTGEIGDGKLFVSSIDDAYRIRTGEQGESSLYLPGEE